MPRELLANTVVPVADVDDARGTARSFKQHVDGDSSDVTAVFVIEKGGGSLDPAPLEKMEMLAEEVLGAFEEEVGFEVDTEVLYGVNVADTIHEYALETDADSILFQPREGGRWLRLITGDTAFSLITRNRVPVVSLPKKDSDGQG
ncbi:MAG: universal stress protein [Halobacteria archaeon]